MILLKLGGALITEKTKPYCARTDVIARLAREVYEAGKEGDLCLVIGHGSGSYGHFSAQKYQTVQGNIHPQSLEGLVVVKNDAAKLHHLVLEAFIEAGNSVFSLQPSACCLIQAGHVFEWFWQPLQRLLNYSIIPMVYGDVAFEAGGSFSIISTEAIFSYLARQLPGCRIILCGNTDGVLWGDPLSPEAQRVKVLTRKNYPEIQSKIRLAAGYDVTGGMAQKVEFALEMADQGVETQIVNGLVPGVLKKTLLGDIETGTRIRK